MTTFQNTPNLPAVAQNGSTVAHRSGSVPALLGNRKIRRAIRKVIDARGSEPVLMPVDALLDGLTAVDLTAVRREVAQQRGEGNILFRCAQCNSPVYLAVSHTASTGDGRGGFFKHHGGSPAPCEWRTPDVMRDTGAGQFGGNQEGEPHWPLKNCLADSIRCDPDFSEPIVDKHFIRIGDGHRRPDVFTTFRGQPIAFELQLARMPLTTITQRTAAYRAAGISLVWVTSAHELAALNNQAFRDLYLASGGRIFAVDAASYERSEATSVLHLRELSLEPCLQHPFAIYNRWRSRMAGPEVILMPEAQRHAEGQRAYAAALAEKLQAQAPGLAEKICSAVASGADLNLVAAEWGALAKLVGARDLRQSIQDEFPRVMRWLQAVERLNNATGEDREVAGKVVAACAAAIVAAQTGKHWISLIEHVADAVPKMAVVLSPELRVKMVTIKASPGKLHPMHAYHRHMISALHPWLAFWLLARAPNGTAPHQRLPSKVIRGVRQRSHYVLVLQQRKSQARRVQMQVTFRGLALEQARDLIFDTKVPNYWFVHHRGTGKTVLMVLAPAERAEAIATELSTLRDWQAVDDWSENDADMVAFAARHRAVVELPEYENGTRDSGTWPDEFDQVAPYR